MRTTNELEVNIRETVKKYTSPWTFHKMSLRSMDHTQLRKCSIQEMELYLVQEEPYPDFYEHIRTRSDQYLGNMLYHVFKIIDYLHTNNIVHGSMSLVVVDRFPRLHAFQLSRWGGTECLGQSIECQLARMDKITLPALKSLLSELKYHVSHEFLEKSLVYYSQFLHQSKEERTREAIQHWRTWDIYALALRLRHEVHRIPFIEKMLHYDPRQRPSLEECIDWFTDDGIDESPDESCETGDDHP